MTGPAVAGLIEARSTSCPDCGGALRWRGEMCFCAVQKHGRDRAPWKETRMMLDGIEAEALLRRRYVVPL